jgi:hypothetical protein
MIPVHPTVRYLLICEDVQPEAANPRRVTIVGLISYVRPSEQAQFPILCREFCVFLQLTECRDPGLGRIEVHHAESGQMVYRTTNGDIPIGKDPLEIIGVTFRIRRCPFPEPGLYWVQFWYNEKMLAEQSLIAR